MELHQSPVVAAFAGAFPGERQRGSRRKTASKKERS